MILKQQLIANKEALFPISLNVSIGGMEGINLLFLLAADNVITESVSNKPSFIGVFDALAKRKDTPLYYSFYVSGKLRVDKADSYSAVLKIVHEDGVLLTQATGEKSSVPVSDLDLKFYFILTKFEKPGKYFLRLELNGNKIDDGDKFYFKILETT